MRRTVFKIGNAISWDSTTGLSSNLENLSRRPDHSSGPIFKGFLWLQIISCDALRGLIGLGLKLEERKKRRFILTTKGM